MSLVKKAREFATDFQAAVRLVSRSKNAAWEGKFVTKECRLTWGLGQWTLEELPAKGKRKLRVATMTNVFHILSKSSVREVGRLMPDNILQDARLGAGDSYESVKKKIASACEDALESLLKDVKESPKPYKEDFSWVSKSLSWYEDQVYFLEVVPENTEPFTVEGKDFSVSVSWTDFEIFSPDTDMQLSDPHYTKYRAKSPAAARKLYNTLKTDPSAMKSVPWGDLSKWFDTKKIPYKLQFSNWS